MPLLVKIPLNVYSVTGSRPLLPGYAPARHPLPPPAPFGPPPME